LSSVDEIIMVIEKPPHRARDARYAREVPPHVRSLSTCSTETTLELYQMLSRFVPHRAVAFVDIEAWVVLLLVSNVDKSCLLSSN
jgi:hypothetical protein